MCSCAWGSSDILNHLNEKREKIGLEPVPYNWMIRKNIFKPIRKIGSSYVWDRKTAKKIVARLLNAHYHYRPNRFLWSDFLKGQAA